MKNIVFAGFLAIISIFGLSGHASAEATIYTGLFINNAVGGYDTVSYFMGDGVPVKGSKKFQTKWNGANWLFSTQENLDKFKASPKKFAPQYGGYCAWAAAHETLAKGDPKNYHIENGKLYLNYDANIHKQWLPRRAELIPVADAQYPQLLQ